MNRLLPVLVVTLTACGGALAAEDAPKPAPAAAAPSKPPSYVPAPGVGSDAGTVAPTAAACPSAVDAPTSCGDYADACAGALPIAVGTFAKITALAVSELGRVHFRVDATDLAPGCGAALYTVDAIGGAVLEPDTGSVGQIGASGESEYWLENVMGGQVLHARGGRFDVTPMGLDRPSSLVSTPSGALVVDASSVYQFTGVDVLPLAPRPVTDGATLAFDGADLFTSGASGLLRLESDGVSVLAPGASDRAQRTVAAAAGIVYYVTGDAESVGGVLEKPMGIFAIAKDGGAPKALVPPGNEVIDSLVVDAQYAYFTVGNEIRRVPLGGGAVTVVKRLGAPPLDLFVDDTSLYFRLDVESHTGEISGPGGVIARIPK